MDKKDKCILRVLEQNARASLKEISKETSFSLSFIADRLNFMRKNGIIEGYRVIVSPEKMGKDLLAFIFVSFYIDPGKGLKLNDVVSELSRLPDIEEAFTLAGSTDALLKLRVKEMSELRAFTGKYLLQKDYVKSVKTSIVLECIRDLH